MREASEDRQSFLGPRLAEIADRVNIGIIGLSGGGSHFAQQLAHVGFRRYCLFDPKRLEEKHLHRVVGAVRADLTSGPDGQGALKVEIAARVIESLRPAAQLRTFARRWQDQPEPLRGCDVIVGCVDSFSDRQQLEAFARRYLIPYLDIGMDVFRQTGGPPRMCGQLVLSMPGAPCLACLGLLTEESLAQEARAYGAVGGRAQVVWANGVLASSGVGVLLDLFTDWTGSLRGPVYKEYDGNTGNVYDDRRLASRRGGCCPHYPLEQVGGPVFRAL